MSLKPLLTTASLLGLVVFAGCAGPSTPPAPSAPAPGAGTGEVCNAQGAQFAVGKVAGAGMVEQARQRSGAYMARILRPNQVVTMEFNAQRLNLEVDAAGVVKAVRCG